MPVDIVVGAQWGDEGKGHITDLLAAEADWVARFNGGDNAGHTVTIGPDIFRLHLIPSGIIHQDVTCVLGNGVVINPAVLLREIEELTARGIDVSPNRLKISRNAHLITPSHIALDLAHETARGDEAIGTTHRGIGPAYTDKASRAGLRLGLLANPELLRSAIEEHVRRINGLLSNVFGAETLEPSVVADRYVEFSEKLAPYLADVSLLLNKALANDQTILAEGAQGTLLDLDHGSYPYVTSSWPTAGGAIIGLGVGPRTVGRVIGVAKAFTSRVGGGPFPSELSGDAASRLRGSGEQPWDEFGTTTGRPRRVGWLDLVILRHAIRINSLTELCLTKLDILSGLTDIPICIEYDMDGERTTDFGTDERTLTQCRPVYHTLPGWAEAISEVRDMAHLPENARAYVDFISEHLEIPIRLISVGPGRDQIIRSGGPR